MPENVMTYVCRKISEDRWLYVTADEKRIVGSIVKEGIRRYRIQLPMRGRNSAIPPSRVRAVQNRRSDSKV